MAKKKTWKYIVQLVVIADTKEAKKDVKWLIEDALNDEFSHSWKHWVRSVDLE